MTSQFPHHHILLLLSTIHFLFQPTYSSNGISTGTTLLALHYKNGIIVAADTRTSVSGYVSNRYASKINFILDKNEFPNDDDDDDDDDDDSDSTCCICRSGSAADTQHLADVVKEEMLKRRIMHCGGNKKSSVSNVAHLLRVLIRSKIHSNPEFLSSLICAGYDHVQKRGVIYSLGQGGSLMEEPHWTAAGSGSTYVLGFLEGGHKVDMEEEDALELVGKAMDFAMGWDGGSGGFVRIYVVDKEGKRAFVRPMSGKLELIPAGTEQNSMDSVD